MNRRNLLWSLAGGLFALALLALIWLLLAGGRSGGGRHGKITPGSNPIMDLRYKYDSAQLAPGPYDAAAEFPLRLESVSTGAESWVFCGKRIRGIGAMLAKAPGPMLYDFVGSQHDEAFKEFYHLTPQGEPKYEDAQFQGQLGLHTETTYKKIEPGAKWPAWMPESVKQGDTLYIQGWALFSPQDLFFFYSASATPLTEQQRKTCEAVIASLQFGAVLGGAAPAPAPEAGKAPETAPPATPDPAPPAPGG